MCAKPVVLLTGASRGLGLGILRKLLAGSTADAGFPAASVVTISRSISPELEQVRAEFPDDLVCVQGDVASEAVNHDAVERALSTWNRGLHAVVLNAGVVVTQKIADMTAQTFADVLNTNTVSLLTTTRAALPALRESKGTVVFVSSGAATGQTAGWAAYNASKAAMNAFARTLANEEPSLAVFAVRPGVVDTDMQGMLRSDGHKSMKHDELDRFLTMHKDGKLLKPDQPGHTIAALATKASRTQPADKDGTPLGAQGAFVNWNAPELAGYVNE